MTKHDGPEADRKGRFNVPMEEVEDGVELIEEGGEPDEGDDQEEEDDAVQEP